MAVSVLSNARTDRTRLSFATGRTNRRPTGSAFRKAAAPVFTVERTLESHEQKLVDTVWNFITPAMVDTSDSFRRPWPRESLTEAVRYKSGDFIETSVSKFIDHLPSLLSLPYSQPVPAPEAACLRAMDLRMTGQSFQAACMLREVIDSSKDCPDIVRLHYADALSALRVHDRELERSGRHAQDEDTVDTVQTALAMCTWRNDLYAGIAEFRFSPAMEETMLRAPLKDFTLPDLFAMISYCHSLITCVRYACTVQHKAQELLANPQAEAATRLFLIGQHLSSDYPLPRRDFLIWRCSQAIRDSVPFHKPLPGLSAHEDALSLFIPEGTDPEPDHVAVLRCWREGRPVQAHQLQLWAEYLAVLIDQRNISALDDALFAVQLIDHPDIIGLQRSLRRLSWKLHSELMPSASWILDYMLLHPLALWVGMSARHGRKFPPVKTPPESSTAESEEQHYQHLQFGFGNLKDRDRDARRFVHAWSILYQCLQYTPAPLDDTLYQLLFLDADLFSWSQLCRRLRQMCESQQHPSSAPKFVSIDGTTQQHGYFAGLGATELFHAGQDRVAQLRRLFEGLDKLRAGLQKVAKSDGVSPGLQHLRALCRIWQARALLESVLDRVRPRSPQKVAAGQSVADDLRRAGQIFSEVCEESKDFAWLAISRLGRNGLLDVHAASSMIGTPASGRISYAESMLSLCDEHHDALQAAVIQFYGTPQYGFVTDDGYLYSTAHQESPSAMWNYAEQACHDMGHTELAVAWVVREATDFHQGRQLSNRDVYGRQGRKLADDAPLSLATVRSPAVLAHLTSHARPSGEVSPDDINQIASSLPADLPAASFILFSRATQVSQGKETAMVRIYAVKTQGRGTHDTITDLPVEVVDTRREWIIEQNHWQAERETEAGLSQLAKGIAALVDPAELLVLVPGPVCLGISIHNLQHDRGSTLWWRNPIVYAPSPSLFRDCVQRALTPRAAVPGRPHTAVVAVEELHRKQAVNLVHDAAEKIAPKLDCTALIGVQVTRAAMAQIFAQQDWVFFIGHGNGGLDDKGMTLHQPGLLLTSKERFLQSNFDTIDLPASHVELIACGSGQFRLHNGMELSSLAETVLVQGGATVLGTMVNAKVDAGIKLLTHMGERLSAALKSDATTWNVAQALRDSARALSDKGLDQKYWGPFFIQGSPVMALAGRR